MKFSDIPGQEDAKRALREPVDSGQVPHALMITGPAGVGKMMLARAYVQYLQCENRRDGEPCGVCRNCRLHQESGHPDVRYVFPFCKPKENSTGEELLGQWREMLAKYPSMPYEKWLELIDAGNSQPKIYVSQSKEIEISDSYPPYMSPYKVFMLWLPENMTVEAANKLLKVLEEPSEGTIFVLVSNNDMEVLPTIYSRVRRVHAGRLSEADLAGYLARRYSFPPDAARQYARMCDGSLQRADELGSNGGEAEEFLAIYQEVMRNAYAKRVLALRKLGDKTAAFGREKNKRFLNYMARMIRENFIYNLRMPQLVAMTPPEEAFSTKFSPFVNHTNVEDFLKQTDLALRDIERNANAKVVMFDYFLYIIIFLHRKPKA